MTSTKRSNTQKNAYKNKCVRIEENLYSSQLQKIVKNITKMSCHS